MSRKILLLAGLSTLAMVQPALAQDVAADAVDEGGLEEIVVTAQKREQNLQDVPVAVTALSGEALASQRINDFADLTKAAPSLTVTQRSSAADNSINIRGIGTFAFTTGVDPSVAVIVDDVALVQQAQAFSNLADIERIEVLRGPQGTLFGKNASAGAVNIVTKGPTSELQGQVGASYASDGEIRINAGISGPLGDSVGFRLSGFFGDQNGYVRNLTTGRRLNDERSKGIRGKLRFEPTDTFELVLAGDWSKSETRGNATTFRVVPAGSALFGAVPVDLTGITPGDGNFNVRLSDEPASTSKQHSFSGRAKLELGFADLISITSYQKWDFRIIEDVDGLAVSPTNSGFGVIQGGPYSSKLFSEELRLVSTGDGPFSYILGGYYADTTTDRTFTRTPGASLGFFRANWTSEAGKKSLAGFAQLDYELTETTRIGVGLRAQNEKIDVYYNRTSGTPVVINEDDSDSAFTWKASLQQDLAPDVMAYVSVAKGYKGQAYDISTSFNQAKALAPTRAESSMAYELGFKSRFLDNRVQLNVAAFWTDYKNFQAQSAVLDPATNTLALGLNNVGKLRTKGVEWELTAKPADGLRFDFSGAYTDAKIRSFPTADCWTNQNNEQPTACFDSDGAGPLGRTQNLAGVRLANAPKWKFNLGGTADLPISDAMDGFASLSYIYQSKVHYDLFNNPYAVQGGYGVLNASVGIKENAETGYKVTLFVNNLTKERFVNFIGDQANLYGNTRHVLTQFVPRGAQRYVGIKLDYSF
jgi:iron complex outermembrane recepter protein